MIIPHINVTVFVLKLFHQHNLKTNKMTLLMKAVQLKVAKDLHSVMHLGKWRQVITGDQLHDKKLLDEYKKIATRCSKQIKDIIATKEKLQKVNNIY